MRTDLTLSSAGGWMHCGAWEKDTTPPGKAARFGTDVHRIVAASMKLSTTHGDSPSWRTAMNALNWLVRLGVELRPEVAYAVATDGGVREIGVDIGRAYRQHGATDGDICGSADVVGPGCVVDVKTGRVASLEKHDAQMRTLGYCVAKTQGLSRVRLVVLHVTEDGATAHEGGMDAMDIDATGHQIRMARTLPPTPTPGPHCDASYCGARKRCPAYWQAKGEVRP